MVDILGFVAPYLVLQELGMWNLLKEGLDLLAPISFLKIYLLIYSISFDCK